MGLFLVCSLFLLFAFYNDQANRARYLINKHFPEFFYIDGKKPVETFDPSFSAVKNISDVSEFRSCNFPQEQIPFELRRHFQKMSWYKWAMIIDFAAIWLYAFAF